jgi:hypothetical protein
VVTLCRPTAPGRTHVPSLLRLHHRPQLVYNVVVQPGEDKFRRLKLSNAKIRAGIIEAEGGLAAIRELGWQQSEEDGEAVLTLPKGVATMVQVGVCVGGVGGGCLVVTCAVGARFVEGRGLQALLQADLLPWALAPPFPQVRAIQEAQQECKKRSAKDLVQRSRAAASLPGSEEQEALRRQLDADRAERATREPVAQASVARQLPGAGGGPNIATAKDVGMTSGCGC